MQLRAAAAAVSAAVASRALRLAFNSWLTFKAMRQDGARRKVLADKVLAALRHNAVRAAFNTWQEFTAAGAHSRRLQAIADRARGALLHRTARAAFSSWVDFTHLRREAKQTVHPSTPGWQACVIVMVARHLRCGSVLLAAL